MEIRFIWMWLCFVVGLLCPADSWSQQNDKSAPKILFDGKKFILPFEKPALQKRDIADSLLVGMPIEAYIEPLNLKISEYKLGLPLNPSQTVKRALLIQMINYEKDPKYLQLMLNARNNVAQILNQSGAKQIKKLGFSLDPVDYLRRRREMKNAERARLIIRDLNKLDLK